MHDDGGNVVPLHVDRGCKCCTAEMFLVINKKKLLPRGCLPPQQGRSVQKTGPLTESPVTDRRVFAPALTVPRAVSSGRSKLPGSSEKFFGT